MAFKDNKVYCPGWTRPVLEKMRRHRACMRPLKFMPGLLNTYLNISDKRTSRLVSVLSDLIVMEYLGEDNIADDHLYIADIGPRYLLFKPYQYARGSVVQKCDPRSVEENQQVLALSYQRLVARQNPRSGEYEICGTNNTIINISNNEIISIALLHPSIINVYEDEEPVEPPWYIDNMLVEKLSKVKVSLTAIGYGESGITHVNLDVLAYHPDPYVSGPRPHIAFVHWNKESKLIKIVLMPFYSHIEEYQYAIITTSLILLALTREYTGLRDIRKIYKKISKHLEKAGLPRPDGGVNFLQSLFPWIINDGESIRTGAPCVECGAFASSVGADMIVRSMKTGALLIL